ncbi:MAG: preprotein translocase subunit SecE [Chloroflexota bacterium]|nr:preprotein translocase subunit SecE [Chloroflexota bacterium]
MSKAATAKKKENPILKYLRETRAEMRKVTWPTREEAINLTFIVLVVTVAMSLFLWTLDNIFSSMVGLIVS